MSFVVSNVELFLFALPLIAAWMLSVFRLDEQLSMPARRFRGPGCPLCGLANDGSPIYVEPDGRWTRQDASHFQPQSSAGPSVLPEQLIWRKRLKSRDKARTTRVEIEWVEQLESVHDVTPERTEGKYKN